MQCNLPNRMTGNKEMTESIPGANSLIVGDLLIKSLLIFKTIASIFLFVIEIVIVTEQNTNPRNSVSCFGFRMDFLLWIVKPRLPKIDTVTCISCDILV